MKLKKLLILLIIGVFTAFLTACDFSFTLFPATTDGVSSTLPVPVNGTISYYESDYTGFSLYQSPTYDLTDINDYNDVLFNTQEHIKHANIEVLTTLTEDRYTFPFVDHPTTYEIGTSTGSGFIFMEDESSYYAVTNFHVINPEEYDATYEILAYNDEGYHPAELFAFDEDLDLAVLKFDKLDRDEIEFINIYERLYHKFNIGEMVLAVGNPYSLINTVTFGELQSMDTISNVDFKVIHHDALIKEGSSGGALVDVDGNLLGVNTWGLDSTEVYSFSIPNYIVYMFLVNNGVLG